MRLIKKHIHAQPHCIRVQVAPGLKDVAADEIKKIIARFQVPGKSQVRVEEQASELWVVDLTYRQMLELTVRVLTPVNLWWRLGKKRVTGKAELQHFIRQLPLPLILPPNGAVRISSASYRSRLYHESMLVGLTSEVLQEKGWHENFNGAFHLHLELNDNQATMFLSLAGEPLSRRGFRKDLHAVAPLNEALAAGLCAWANVWADGERKSASAPDALWVPFLGSGTLLFEAMLYFADISPLLLGRRYSFQDFLCHVPGTESFLLERLASQAEAGLSQVNAVAIAGCDLSPGAVEEARRQTDALAACFSSAAQFPKVSLGVGDFFESLPPPGERLFLPLHPPYGLRLKDPGAIFWARLGKRITSLSHREIVGFCLVPDEVSWREFLNNLSGFRFSTRHITQGGRDIRAAAFGRF